MSSVLPSPPQHVAEALARETSAPGLLHATCRELVELLDASACALSRVIGELLVGLAEYARSGRRLQLGHGYVLPDYPLTRDVIERAEPRFVSLLDDDPDPSEAVLLRELGFDSLLMLPLPSQGLCWGLVEVYVGDGRRFRDEEARLAERVVARAGELLERLEHGTAAGR